MLDCHTMINMCYSVRVSSLVCLPLFVSVTPDVVIVHDVVRPFVDVDLIYTIAKSAHTYGVSWCVYSQNLDFMNSGQQHQFIFFKIDIGSVINIHLHAQIHTFVTQRNTSIRFVWNWVFTNWILKVYVCLQV